MSGSTTQKVTKEAAIDRDHRALRILTSQYKRINGAGLPAEPYIVYVDDPPRPYHCRPDISNTPFSPNEWQLQYQTLHYREFPDSILRLRAAHEPDLSRNHLNPGKRSIDDPPHSLPSDRPAKKKMTLSDYKTRVKSRTQPSTPALPTESNLRSDTPKVFNLTNTKGASHLRHDSNESQVTRQHSDWSENHYSSASEDLIDPGGISPRDSNPPVNQHQSSNNFKRDLSSTQSQNPVGSDGTGQPPLKKRRNSSHGDQSRVSNGLAKSDSPLEPFHSRNKLSTASSDNPHGSTGAPIKSCTDGRIISKQKVPQIHVSPVFDDTGELNRQTPAKIAQPMENSLQPLKFIPPRSVGRKIGNLPSFRISNIGRKGSSLSPTSTQAVGQYPTSETSTPSTRPSPNHTSPEPAALHAHHVLPRPDTAQRGMHVKSDSSGAKIATSSADSKSQTLRGTGKVSSAKHKDMPEKQLAQKLVSNHGTISRKTEIHATKLKGDPGRERKVNAPPSSFFANMAGAPRPSTSRAVTPANTTKTESEAAPVEIDKKVVVLKYGQSRVHRVQDLLKTPSNRLNPVNKASKDQNTPQRTVPPTKDGSVSSAKQEQAPTMHPIAKTQGSPIQPSSLSRTEVTSQPAKHVKATATSKTDWNDEFKRYSGIGKTLKREMQSIARKDGVANQKLAAVAGIESVLCWIQAFAASDQIKANSKNRIQNWESVLPLAKEVAQVCHAFPHLFGFALFLRSIICGTISDLLSRTPHLDERETNLWRETSQMLHRLVKQSGEHINLDTLLSSYPSATKEIMTMALGGITDPVMAARVGRKLLGEWTEKEGVVWSPKIE